MSSTYHLWCLSHDPAMEIREISRQDVNALSADAFTGHDLFTGHEKCDVAVTRSSGGLVEVGCIKCKMHLGIDWQDASWLRLLVAATTPPNTVTADVLWPLTRCWSRERVRPLRIELGYEPEAGRDDASYQHEQLVAAARYILREIRGVTAHHPLLPLIDLVRHELLEALGEKETTG